MEALFEGVKEFNAGDFHQYEELYRQLSKKQNPHTLFIGCSDSRVVPNLITKTMKRRLHSLFGSSLTLNSKITAIL